MFGWWPAHVLQEQAQAERRDLQHALQCQREEAWHEAVSIAASQVKIPVVRCPACLARTGLLTLLGSVVDALGQSYSFWASMVETNIATVEQLLHALAETARRSSETGVGSPASCSPNSDTWWTGGSPRDEQVSNLLRPRH